MWGHSTKVTFYRKSETTWGHGKRSKGEDGITNPRLRFTNGEGDGVSEEGIERTRYCYTVRGGVPRWRWGPHGTVDEKSVVLFPSSSF